MELQQRTLLAAAMAAILVVVVGTLAYRKARQGVEVAAVRSDTPAASPTGVAARQPGAAAARESAEGLAAESPTVPAPPAPEPLIEDLLAEHGEDSGAVYYMSRVREALREGNPIFARELLEQMKEQHPSSVLLEEAAALFEGTR